MTPERLRFHEFDRMMRDDRPSYGAWRKRPTMYFPLRCGHGGFRLTETRGYCPECREYADILPGPAQKEE